MQKFVFTSC